MFDGDILEDQSFTFVLPLIAARQACQGKEIRAHANLFDHHEEESSLDTGVIAMSKWSSLRIKLIFNRS